MLDRQTAFDLLERVLALSPAEQTEATLSGGETAAVRFVRNEVVLPFHERRYQLFIRVISGGRIGRGATNRFDDDGIREALAMAVQGAAVWDGDADVFFPGPDEAPAGVSDETSPSMPDPAFMLDCAGRIIAGLRAAGAEGTGVLAQATGSIHAGYGWPFGGERVFAVANSNGLRAHHVRQAAHFSVTINKGRGEVWHNSSGLDFRTMDIDPLIAVLAGKAAACAELKSLKPGRYTVILEPSAAAPRLAGLGRMCMAGGKLAARLGEQVFGPHITVIEDPFHPLLKSCPFNNEGRVRKKTVLIEKGVVKEPVYDRRRAAEQDKPLSGYDFPVPGFIGRGHYDETGPSAVTVSGGEQSLAQMIASTDRGILMSGSYGDISDAGCGWIEDGRVMYGLEPFFYKQDLMEMIDNIDLMSVPERMDSPFLTGAAVVPAVRVRGFRCEV